MKLQSCCLNITDGEHGTVIDDDNGQYYLLSNKNIINSTIYIDKNDRRINKSCFDKINRRTKIAPGDVLISTVGTIGKTAVIEGSINYVFQRSVGIIKPNPMLLDSYYLKYLLDTNCYQNLLKKNAKGAVQKCIFIDDLKNLDIPLPPINEQKKAVLLLQILDRKISLNRSINKELETMAKQLYDYWFVQFDFPDANGKPYKSSGGEMVNGLPKNWSRVSLNDILNDRKVKQINPQNNQNCIFKHLSFPSFDDTKSYYEELGADIHSNKIVVTDDYVLAAKLNPWIKRIAWGTSEENLICSTEFVVLSPKNKGIKAFLYTLANQPAFIDYCTTSSTGTSHSQRRVKPEIMKQYTFAYNEDVAKEYSNIVSTYIEKQQAIIKEIRKLTTLRDELLPLLMNGQVIIK